MALDIRLSRPTGSDEPWGFRLIGGSEFNAPLTVVKVDNPSLAYRGGLRPGDQLIAVGATSAAAASHEDAHRAIQQSGCQLDLQVTRGQYDAVLDDQEPIFEPLEQDDFVQPSDPTEVLLPPPLPYPPALPEDSSTRSQTASPFLLPTKPYRPFSTEPINEVPPLEDPIILNPSYHDQFGNLHEDFLPKTKFKLPISEQYDPDYGKEKKERKCKVKSEMKSEVLGEKCEVMTQDEISFLKQMKTDIDLVKMEETAMSTMSFNEAVSKSSINERTTGLYSKTEENKTDITVQEKAMTIVDQSILEAISAVEEITQGTAVNSNVKLQVKESKAEIIEKISESTLKESSIMATDISKDIIESSKKDFKTILSNAKSVSINDDSKSGSSVKEEIQETIKAGTVKRLSTSFDKENEMKAIEKQKDVQKHKIVTSNQDSEQQVKSQECKLQKEIKTITNKQQKVTSDQKTEKTDVKNESNQKMSTSRLLAEQRAYTIGLQTIPKIRGSVHSSYHYDLLLKTFFIHLTDVMVALSRFILTEPVISKSETVESDVTTQKITEQASYRQKEETNLTTKEVVTVKSDIVEHIKEDKNVDEKVIKQDRSFKSQEDLHEKKKSGAEMAQLMSKKSEQLIQGMGAVITEFQAKSGIEDNVQTTETQEKSYSRIEEEIAKVSDPLEWLSKEEVQTRSTELTEVKQSTKIARTEQINTDTSKLEIKKRDERSRSKSREGRTIYVATVESHVYTNKDEILDEQLSDTSTVEEKFGTEYSDIEVSQVIENVSEEVKDAAKCITEKIKEVQVTESNFEQHREQISVEQVSEVIEKVENSAEKIECVKEETKMIEEKSENSTEILANENTYSQITQNDESRFEKMDMIQIEENLMEPKYEIREEEEQVIVLRRPSAVITEDVTAVVEVPKEISPLIIQETIVTEKQSSETFVAEATFEAKSTFESTKIEESAISQTMTEEKVEETTESQNALFTALTSSEMQKKRESLRKLSLKSERSLDSFPSSISTPTPATIPPTPLTDEYIFRLECTPKHLFPSDPEQPEPSPEKEIDHEDPYTVKKKFIPHIETKIEQIVYNPPLATPVEVKDVPSFTPLNGVLKEKVGEEEIREIERKSSLLASVIDETVKSIQKYNDKISMDSKKEVKIKEESVITAVNDNTRTEQVAVESQVKSDTENKPMYASYVKEAKTTIFADAIPDIEKTINKTEEFSNVDCITALTDTTQLLTKSAATFDSVSSAIDTNSLICSAKTETNLKEEVSDQIKETSQTKVTFKVADLKAMTQEVKAENKMETKSEGLQGYRPVSFNPDEIRKEIAPPPGYRPVQVSLQGETEMARPRSVTVDGETLGSKLGIVDGPEQSVVDTDLAKELGKPGLSEEQIAELISGESEMLREAHVMGLSRVIASHMTRPAENDSSVDFKKIKPTIEKLKDSEVLKALNDELTKTKTEKKEEERKWTTFLQRPQRAAPTAKFGYHGWLPQFIPPQEQYKVKIVKQPKPKVAPDYKPEVFETGPLPWEERAAREPPPPPPCPEDPILVPEEGPEFLQAVDPLPESEVPDLEDTGIPLPPEKVEEEQPPTDPVEQESTLEEGQQEPEEEQEATEAEKESEETEDMDQNRLAEQLLNNVQTAVDPSAPLEQQLAQMRLQLAALAQLPQVIQHSLEIVTNQLLNMSHQETKVVTETTEKMEITEVTEVTQEETNEVQTEEVTKTEEDGTTEQKEEPKQVQVTSEEIARMRQEEALMMEERERLEKQKKVAREIVQELMQQQLEHESRLVKERPTPRPHPRPAFGPLVPQERPLVLPGGRRWRKPQDAYNDQFIAETLAAQAEIIQGKAKGSSYDNDIRPYDQRINFKKYEKPPVSLEHLRDSETYKLVHGEETQERALRVHLLTPVIAESDYREKCRSVTPCTMQQMDMSQQHQP